MKLSEERKYMEIGRKKIERKKLVTIEAIEVEEKKVTQQMVKNHRQDKIFWGMCQELRKRKDILTILNLPEGSQVKYRGIPLYGPTTKIAGHIGILKEKRRKRALVDFGELGKWTIRFENLAPAEDKCVSMITPGLAKQMSGMGQAINKTLAEAVK